MLTHILEYGISSTKSCAGCHLYYLAGKKHRNDRQSLATCGCILTSIVLPCRASPLMSKLWWSL
jgi:hypothetical protein